MLGKHKKLLTNLESLNLDIRQTHNGRWYDQKVTPDVMSVICESIINFQEDTGFSVFSKKDIRESNFLEDCVKHNFGKPSPQNPGTALEYDKFIGQPLHVLVSSGILTCQLARPQAYMINDSLSDVLSRIAGNEQESIEFLNVYITEVLRQSNLSEDFQNFFESQDQPSFYKLKSTYRDFIWEHTPIKGKYEPNRIFPKVLNILAYVQRNKGSIGGKISKMPITLNDIRYNRINFRDIAKKKPKHIPRKQYNPKPLIGLYPQSRPISQVIRDVKNFHDQKPEIEDGFSSVDIHSTHPVEGHHIFPRSEYPQFATLRENIILLTPTQHKSQAHGESGKCVSPYYQHFCLQKKLDSIKKCHNNNNCCFYSFHLFKEMLSAVGIISEDKVQTFLFDDILRELTRHYQP